MAHKVWSDEEEKWVEASVERIQELQANTVKPGSSVPLPPVTGRPDTIPLPDGVDDGDTLWMTFNEQLNLDRARP